MIDGIIFDVDGTLWDTTEVVAKGWNKALAECGFEERVTADRLKGLFGLPMETIIEDILPNASDAERAKFKPLCYSYEEAAIEEESGRLYPEIGETLTELAKKYKLFIVSNCQAGYIELFTKKCGFEKLFADHLCPGDTGVHKAENIKLIMQRNNLKNCVYVGDTSMDFEACQKAGVPMVFAGYGFGKVENPAWKISQPADLLNIQF